MQKDFPQNLLPPIVEFADEEGKTYRVALTDGEGLGSVVGARIGVRYHRENPGEVHPSSMVGLWIFSLMFTVMGSLFLVAGVVAWVFRASIRFR